MSQPTPLYNVRTASGLSQGALARALGKNRATISRIESGEAQASPELAKLIAEHFVGKITRDEILFPELHAAKKPPVSTAPRKKLVRKAS